MLNRIIKLVSPNGRLTGQAYLLLGLFLFFIKHAIDAAIVRGMLGISWSPLNYLAPGAAIGMPLQTEKAAFFIVMLAISLPFIGVGLVLTLRRLRTVGLPAGLLVLFFVPLVNFIFFVAIAFCRAPAIRVISVEASIASSVRQEAGDGPRLLNYGRDEAGPVGSVVGKLIPREPFAAAWVAVLAPTPFALLSTLFSVAVLREYGWGLFVGLPFILGMVAVLVRGYHRPLTKWQSGNTGMLAVAVFGVSLMAFSMEGAICILMAMPLALTLGLLGALLAHVIVGARRVGVSGVVPALLLFLPLFMGAERLARPEAPVYEVSSVVEIDAPPERVWGNVISFGQLSPPKEWIFRLGVAYPMRAEIVGSGVGAMRYCVFSTGPFVEPIRTWDEPRVLAFDVTENPPPMKEWSPYHNIQPPHLESFLVSHGGRFRLTALPDGRTRLEGTTWYQHHMWPAGYWRIWSDRIIHTIHLRVLYHVKELSERKGTL